MHKMNNVAKGALGSETGPPEANNGGRDSGEVTTSSPRLPLPWCCCNWLIEGNHEITQIKQRGFEVPRRRQVKNRLGDISRLGEDDTQGEDDAV